MAKITDVMHSIDRNMDKSVERLFDFIKIPSISTDPAYFKDVHRAAVWLVRELNSIGFDAALHETSGHPMVVAKHDGADENAPHVLFYGHYDVQPVDPLELWKTNPFESAIIDRNGRKVIAGRGAADDKGQLMTFVEACRAWKDARGILPCQVTILFEGEEESGSPSLGAFLEASRDLLKADFALVCDTNMWDADTPAICAGLRGLVGEEVTVIGPDKDLHSGYFGGAAANPLRVLSKILADLHDDSGRVTLPGFYDGVYETPQEVLDVWDSLGCTPETFLGGVGLSEPAGEEGRSVLEMVWARPTAEVNGIVGGYTGQGFKTVIPSRASAKVSFRLVHDQDPESIRASFREFVEARIPKDCTVEFQKHGGSKAVQLAYDSPRIQTVRRVLSDVWKKEAVNVALGGSIPVVGDFQRMLGMESLLVGFGLADDQIHSPNEKYELKSFHLGQRSWASILNALAEEHRN